jgi:hypothetical protein
MKRNNKGVKATGKDQKSIVLREKRILTLVRNGRGQEWFEAIDCIGRKVNGEAREVPVDEALAFKSQAFLTVSLMRMRHKKREMEIMGARIQTYPHNNASMQNARLALSLFTKLLFLRNKLFNF